jgi:LuxR family transcriptional regulator
MFFLALDRQLDHAENQFMQSLMPCIQTYLLKVKQFDEQPSVTQKEAEVLKWISEGKTNWEIGVILSVSERTAKFHVHNLYKKFNVNSRSLLVARAIRQGCI